jgi:hypothetical protein
MLIVIMMNTLDLIIPKRMAFVPPNKSNHQQTCLLDAFVDNTSLGFTDHGNLDFTSLTKWLGEIAQTWEHFILCISLLRAQNLKNKHSYHMLFWEWKAGRPVIHPIHNEDLVLKIYHGTNCPIKPICRTNLTSASRILDVQHISTVDNFHSQIQVLTENCEQFALL